MSATLLHCLTALSGLLWLIASRAPAFQHAYLAHEKALQKEQWMHAQCQDPVFAAEMQRVSAAAPHDEHSGKGYASICERVQALFKLPPWKAGLQAACSLPDPLPGYVQDVMLWTRGRRWPWPMLAVTAVLLPAGILPLYRGLVDDRQCQALIQRLRTPLLQQGRRKPLLPVVRTGRLERPYYP